jgi:hypothetical protein
MVSKLAVFALGLLLSVGLVHGDEPASSTGASAKSARVFELRTYTAAPGKLEELHARFRAHTMRIFERHGMTNIGYWTPQDSALADNTIIYVLAHESRDAAKKSWAAFGADPEWQRVKAASEAQGPIVSKVESMFLDATDYSPIK